MIPILATFGTLDWMVLGLYWVVMIYMGVIAARRGQNTEEYFLGERSLPTWAVAISVVATSLSAATFVGAPAESYGGDVSYLILNIGGFMSVFIVAWLFVPRLYQAGTITIYGYLEQRFGPGARTAASCMFLFGRLLASGARLFMAAIPLCLLLFGTQPAEAHEHRLQMMLAIALIGLTGTFYTMMGGIRTIVWIDVVQFALVVGTVAVSIGMLLYRIPLSVPEIVNVLAAPGTGPSGSKLHLVDFSTDLTKPYTIWTATLGVVFLNVASLGVDHDLAQRFLVAKSSARGGLSLIYSQCMSIGVVSMFLVVGLLLWVYYQWMPAHGGPMPMVVPATARDAYPVFLLHELPPVLGGLAIAGFFAIAQASMDSAINALASSLVADLYYPWLKYRGKTIHRSVSIKAPKAAVVAMGVTMCLFAVLCAFIYDPNHQTLLQFALGVMNFAYTGLLGVFLTALLTRRGNVTSVLIALAVGVIIVTLLQKEIMSWWTLRLLGQSYSLAVFWWTPIGTIICFLVCFSGSPQRRKVAPT